MAFNIPDFISLAALISSRLDAWALLLKTNHSNAISWCHVLQMGEWEKLWESSRLLYCTRSSKYPYTPNDYHLLVLLCGWTCDANPSKEYIFWKLQNRGISYISFMRELEMRSRKHTSKNIIILATVKVKAIGFHVSVTSFHLLIDFFNPRRERWSKDKL